MGKKIFISYKYGDTLVEKLPNVNYFEKTKVRDYVTKLQELLENDHINKGEKDNEDMGSLADSTIGSKLGDKIFDSTITLVLISKGMKDKYKSEKDQWIPWEISYSLREQSRSGQRSKTNAILMIILPDENGSYEYFITKNEICDSTIVKTNFLFNILKDNMFNIKNPEVRDCNGNKIYSGQSSYIDYVKWEQFIKNKEKYIELALEVYRNRDKYDIVKNLKK